MGCPHTCVFCNQKTISGTVSFSLEKAEKTIREGVATLDGRGAEIAFFGGSFTAIDRELMCALLSLAKKQVDCGAVSGIRLSTRPDAIDEELLQILGEYGVSAIELGCQSTSDEVLSASGRGHTKEQIEKAFDLIKRKGSFELTGQMMLGLPCSTLQKEVQTARDLIAFGADAVRIYPTLVLENTALADLYQKGLYQPLSLEEGVARCAVLVPLFEDAGVKILRMGLHAEEGFEKGALAGCYHPAFGELVENRIFEGILQTKFENLPSPEGKTYTIFVAPGCLSKAIGQNRCNKLKLMNEYGCALHFKEDRSLSKRQVQIEEGANRATEIS
jgi:histone acetyltransferase (RNA polymerase elongator complex component)